MSHNEKGDVAAHKSTTSPYDNQKKKLNASGAFDFFFNIIVKHVFLH